MRDPYVDSMDLSGSVGDRAAEALAPEAGLFENPDVAEFGKAVAAAAQGAVRHPGEAAAATMKATFDLMRVPSVALARWFGADVAPPVPVEDKDKRFADPAWSQSPAFFALRQAYAAACRLSDELIEAAELDPVTARKAKLALDLALDAAAPTNFPLTNPAVLKRAFETGGASVVTGLRHLLEDIATNQGRPHQVDKRSFRVGENLAATPCKVVYRNDIMELLQYEPQTPQVHAAPLLFSPPWINKYYVMDLAPGRSFVEWAVKHGRTVFVISYRNPPDSMSRVTMDDYLVHGPHQALDVIQDITGADTIDVVGLCLGGALTAIAAAYLRADGDDRLGSLTLLNTMLDYSEPGALGAFTDRATVERLEKRMQREGHLPGASMAGTFDVLRANDLIFNYVVANWLMGQDPPAFDILAWNADSTRMPAAMHSFYLRNFYVENRLAKGELEIAGQQIDLGLIKGPVYLVAAENDHIVPWRSAYAGSRLLGSPPRFVLSSGGHIAGIVNPPTPKAWYVASDGPPEGPGPDGRPAEDAQAWREGAQRHRGSWWEDWAVWSAENAGDLVDPPPTGSAAYPVLGVGPGDYVHT